MRINRDPRDPQRYFNNFVVLVMVKPQVVPFKSLIVFLMNLCIYTLLLLAFFFIRSLYRIYDEGRLKLFGSGFGTRLVTAFVGFIIVPSLLLFILSSLLITY